MSKLFTELKRRNVIRVGAAYMVASWVLLQIGDVLFDMMEMPDWAGKLLVSILALGFPLTLIFAWAFELTPEGLKTDAQAEHSGAVSSVTAKKLDMITIIMVVAALGLFAADRLLVSRQAPPIPQRSSIVSAPPDASVAVLPFENISQDAANEPFTIGIHDDLLTQISKIGSLKTISRTSVLRYRDSIKTVNEIAAELGVATVLEGGVQRAGDMVRINVQLIDARTSGQLWAERYERQLSAANIFAIQNEIVKAIADALKTTLSPVEKQQIESVPTDNLAALESYFRGRQRLAERSTVAIQEAIDSFDRAIALDPGFALAYVGLSESYQILEDLGGMQREEMFEKAGAAVDKALELDSNSGPAYTSLAGLKMSEGDYAAAEAMFKKSIELNSNYVMTYHWYGILLQDMGRVDEAAAIYRKGVERDPRSAQLNEMLGTVMEVQGRFDDALRQYRKSISIDENNTSSYQNIGNNYWMASGSLDDAVSCHAEGISRDPGSSRAQSWHGLLYLDLGRVSEAKRWIESSLDLAPLSQEARAAMALLDWYRGLEPEAYEKAEVLYHIVPYYWDQRLFQSMALAMLRNQDAKQGKMTEARERYEETYPALLSDDAKIDIQNYRAAIDLAFVLQQTGDNERAALLLERSKAFIENSTIPRLGVGGYGIADVQIHALRGEPEVAVSRLRKAIDEGWRGFWWFYLKNNPNLESLAGNSEFRSMVSEVEAFMMNQPIDSAEMGACAAD